MLPLRQLHWMKLWHAIKSRVIFGCVTVGLACSAWAQNDPGFDAQVEYSIHAMLPQPDGRVLVGGDLISLNGVRRDRIGRLNSDGSLDYSFNPDTNGVIYAAALLTNGQVLVGGNFSTFGGLPRAGLARLDANGTVDAAFTNGVSLGVNAMAVQADGRVLVGGTFTTLAGQSRTNIGRLNAEGSLDAAFNPGADGPVYSIATQPDGKILVGGGFGVLGGLSSGRLGRLNTNGTLDTNFVASFYGDVYSVAVQPDGKILVGGPFIMVNGDYRYGFARLHSNGSLDTNFTATPAPGYLCEVTTISLQCDGKIIVGGSFTGWFTPPCFARFYPDGTVDTNFVVSAPGSVRSAVIQRDGRILRTAQHSIARMTNAPATESLTYSNSIITWLRGGSAPEAWRTTFEFSTNRTNWTVIGPGTRVAGGWQRTGVSAPTNALIRARAFTSGGLFNSSSYFVEGYAGPVMILGQPASRTNNATTTATFAVVADGTPPLTYRWRKNGTNLTDGGNISGATNATLTLTNVLRADAADYSVVVSNNYGAITSAVATLAVIDPFLVTPPVDQYVNAGDNALFSVSATGTSPLRYQWQRNGSPVAGATNALLSLMNVHGGDAGGLFRVVVTNSAGVVTSTPALLTVNRAAVEAFNPLPNYPVHAVAVQPDGKILMAGGFSFVNGSLQAGIARLAGDGSLDLGFQARLLGAPGQVALQPDGNIVIAGHFSSLDQMPRDRMGRLNPGGLLDADFDPGVDAEIMVAAIQPDGKIIVAGGFTQLASQPCSRIGRLNEDGTLDTNFTGVADGTVHAVALQLDGKVLVGGSFTNLGGLVRTNLGRLNPDGTLDSNFVASADATVKTIALLANGSIAVAGDFTMLNGQPRSRLGRLGPNGALDPAFNPAPDGPVNTLAVEVEGRILVGGTFMGIGGRSRTNLARLNDDGGADMTFNPGADGTVSSLAIQPDGKVLVAGAFNNLNGQPRPFLGRLTGAATATNDLSYNISSITWSRSGSGPEVWTTVFDVTTNGTTWQQYQGMRISGGWQVSGLNLTGNLTIRARGYVAGSSDGSSWVVENGLGPVVILSQPVSWTNQPFTFAQFNVEAVGGEPPTYQWLKNGMPLTDTGNISGAHTAWLNIGSVLGADAAAYQVVISNGSGTITSGVATLTVIDPLITRDPVGQTNNAGTPVSFSASAIGTTNLSYQWLKNGTNMMNGGTVFGANTSEVIIAGVLGHDAGAYQLVASNVWGSVTSSVASLAVIDPLLVTNPVSQLGHRGLTATFNVAVKGAQPLTYLWRHDGMPFPPQTNSALVLTNLQWTDAGAYDVIVTNQFGSVTSAVAALSVNMAVPDSADLAINGNAYSMALQPDGKILLGGVFTSVAGQTRNRIARLNADGTLDTAFNPNARGNSVVGVFSFAVQPDGKILVGGSFTNIAGVNRSNLVRLHPDGSLDSTFAPNPNQRVMSMLVQPDGKIVLGGVFSTVSGLPCSYIGRIYSDGSLDTNFQATADVFVTALAPQPDGRILIAGNFSTLCGQPRNNLGRLNPDGSLDSTFTNLPNSYVNAMAGQPGGGLLIAGSFTQFDGQPRNGIARLAPNGLLDPGFAPNVGGVSAFAPLADGRVLVGPSMIMVNADGSLDSNYNPTPNGTVFSLIAQPDGRILAAGAFTTMGGQPHSRFARFNDGGVPTESLFSDATSVTWLRGGAGPELSRVSFETTTNGTAWTPLGEGSRVTSGWQRTGVALPPNAVIRARGFAGSSGLQSSSEWFMESLGGAPLVVTQPVSRTNNANTTATFSASGIGAPPLQFQWLKNGSSLGIGGNISGTNATTLTLSNVFGADAGGYSLVLSNASGVVTSAVAVLTVVDPLITTNPASLSAGAGQSAMFSVAVIGSAPLNFQWRQNGIELAGANTSTLTLTNLQAANAGAYDVIITNGFSTVTSSVATLTVNLAMPDAFSPGANGPVYALALQPDGKILAGGSYTVLGGQVRRNLGRLNADGTVDAGFSTNYTNSFVNALVVRTDGRIFVGGSWSDQNRLFVTSLWRLDAGGSLEVAYTNYFTGTVNALASTPDEGLWVGGSFTVGKPGITTNLARLNPDSSYDSNFVAAINGIVNALGVQPDGKLVIGGSFTTVNGTNRNRLARFSANGMLDTNFNPNANGTVNALALQPDGNILVGGQFTTLGGTNCNRLARLFPNGSVDTNFNPNANGTVTTLALQADEKVLIGGSFTTVGGLARNRLARLNADGTLDSTFNPGANNIVNAFAIQPDGAIVVGGGGAASGPLTQLDGLARTNLGRLANTAAATQSLAFNGTTATWLRGGTGPEFWRTSFEGSTNGVDWISLGGGTWITNGWQWTGTPFPMRSMIRARGFVTGGLGNGSSWFIENITPSAVPPALVPATGYAFNILALPGQVIVIEATEDFTVWTPVQTNVVTDLGAFLFAESQAGIFPHRFYRARLFNGALPQPAIAGVPSINPDGFAFGLAGTPGQSLVVETSTNLQSWTPLTTNLLATGSTNFIDPGATNLPWNFYRLRLQSPP